MAETTLQDDGGPAFARSGFEADPSEKSTFDTPPQKGMTLRDYFAAAALTGLMTTTAVRSPLERAQAAYTAADAMLAARKK